LGYDECTQKLDLSNVPSVIKHFEEAHGATTEKGSQVIIRHVDFPSAINSRKHTKWSPVLLSLNGSGNKKSLFMVLGLVDVPRYFVSWGCVQICPSDENALEEKFEMKFSLVTKNSPPSKVC